MPSPRRAKTIEEAWRVAPWAGLGDGRRTLAFIRRLRGRGIQTVPELIRAFPRMRPNTQRAAVNLLGETNDRRAVPLLTRLFEEGRFCPLTDLALEFLGGPRALAYLKRVVEEEIKRPARERDEGPLFCALSALGTMEDNLPARDLLLRVAGRSDLGVDERALAVDALGMMAEEEGPGMPGRRRVERAVLKALGDASPVVRMNAISAADCMGLRSARPHLRRMAASDHARVRDWGRISVQARRTLAALDEA